MAEQTKTKVMMVARYAHGDGYEVVVFYVDGDIYKYLIDRAMLAEAPARSKASAKTWLNYIKKCPGKCEKNHVPIAHCGVEPTAEKYAW